MAEEAEQDLLDAVKEALLNNGYLGRFRAEMRATVLEILNISKGNQFPGVPEETKFINELIREYLSWNGYKYAEQILVAETGMSKDKPNREYLTVMLNAADDDKTGKIPLLYYIVSSFQNQH